MNKYKNSKIYKLTNDTGMCYYGSTINDIQKRYSKHFCAFKSGHSQYTSKLLLGQLMNNKVGHSTDV
jgi:predicted GIY-YIG superfamily endonuclease